MDNKKMLYEIANELDKLGYSENADNIRNNVLYESYARRIDYINNKTDKLDHDIWIDDMGDARRTHNLPRVKIYLNKKVSIDIIIPLNKNEKPYIDDNTKNKEKVKIAIPNDLKFINKYKEIFISLYYYDEEKDNYFNSIINVFFKSLGKCSNINTSIDIAFSKFKDTKCKRTMFTNFKF